MSRIITSTFLRVLALGLDIDLTPKESRVEVIEGNEHDRDVVHGPLGNRGLEHVVGAAATRLVDVGGALVGEGVPGGGDYLLVVHFVEDAVAWE